MVKKEYVACPLCGWNKALESEKRIAKKKSVRYSWPNFSLEKAFIMQIREGGGKRGGSGAKGRGKAPGIGFKLLEGESLTLSEMAKNDAYSQILARMKKQLIRVVYYCVKEGIMERSELKLPTEKPSS
jgi:hypothetical protein